MRVPVIAVLPSQESLRAAATAALQGQSPQPHLESATLPSQLTIDPSFAAVPVGTGSAEATLEGLQPDTSERFAVRAFVEVESPDQIPAEVDGHPMFADPEITPLITCGGTPPVGTAATVATKLKVSTLATKGLTGDGVAVAIMDTGINLAHLTAKLGFTPKLDVTNSWRPPGSTTAPGTHPVGHGTMCAYDVMISAPKATLLDFPILASSAPGGAVTGRTLSVALLGFAQLIAFWGVAFAPGGSMLYRALVSNNSWGVFHPSWDFPAGHPGRYIDNPNHPFNIIVNTLVRARADILFAAGNCGSQCADGRCQGRTTQTIMGASALPSVLTLAGCDTNDQRVGYSSQGPSIAGMFQHKPDVTAYTHFKGSEAFGANSPDSGTSAACPVASGVVAALRTKVSVQTTPPNLLFDRIRGHAHHAGAGTGWNGDYGFGIIDPVATATALGV
jgi:subtilisin family serine protease